MAKYEYKTVALRDDSSGSLDVDKLNSYLERYSKEGWRLVSSLVNEIGKNSRTSGYGGYSTSVNATIDETILIFEREMVEVEQNPVITKCIPIITYGFEFPYRFTTLTLMYDKRFRTMSFYMNGKTFSDKVPDVLQISIDFNTIFDKKYTFADFNFYGFDKGRIANSIQTSEKNLDITLDQFEEIVSASCSITAIMLDGEQTVAKYAAHNSLLTLKELKALRYKCSFAVNRLENREKNWTCWCGMINDMDKQECPYCGTVMNKISCGEDGVIAAINSVSTTSALYEVVKGNLDALGLAGNVSALSEMQSTFNFLMEQEKSTGESKVDIARARILKLINQE